MTISVLGAEQFEGYAGSLTIDTDALAATYGMVDLDVFLVFTRCSFTRVGGRTSALSAAPNQAGSMASLGAVTAVASTDDFDFDYQSGGAGSGEGQFGQRGWYFEYYSPDNSFFATLAFDVLNHADVYIVCDIVMLRTSLVDPDLNIAYTGYMEGRGAGFNSNTVPLEPFGLAVGWTDAEGFGLPGWPSNASDGVAIVFTAFNADREAEAHASETRLGSPVFSTRWIDADNAFAGQPDKGYGCGTYIATGISLSATEVAYPGTPNRSPTGGGTGPTLTGNKHWSGEFITQIGPLLDASNTHTIGYLGSTVVFFETLPTLELPTPTDFPVGYVGFPRGGGEG